MTAPLVTLDVTGNAAVIRLNRPSRHNALVPELLEDLIDALGDERSRNARTVILAAEGRSFSTGGDLLGFWQPRAATSWISACTLVGSAKPGRAAHRKMHAPLARRLRRSGAGHRWLTGFSTGS